MEVGLGYIFHITSALSESSIRCVALGSPWRGTGRTWGDSFNLRMVPRVEECCWLLWNCSAG